MSALPLIFAPIEFGKEGIEEIETIVVGGDNDLGVLINVQHAQLVMTKTAA